MRVVSGELRGRRIDSPPGDATRPTTDKVREAVFNALGSLDVVADARVLDLFAGTGAMGIEALSRGAVSCSFVENDRGALAVLRHNIDTLGLGDRATVVAADAHSACRGSWDIVIADPPYGETDWVGLLSGLECSVAVIESGRPIGVVPGWETLREKRYGRTHVAFLRPAASPEGTVESQ